MAYSVIDRPCQLNREIVRATAILRQEIQQREQAEVKVRHMALHDSLTNLANRRLFYELGEHALAIAKRAKKGLAILFIDIDGFKAVNDGHGHAIGDRVLQMIALRLKLQVRKSDIVARFGGDEFVILLVDSSNDDQGAIQVATKVIDSIAKLFAIRDQQIYLGCSIGIAKFHQHGTTIEELLKLSDAAMYDAKNSGKNCFRLAKVKH